jgi:hypothetical protein
VPSSCFDVEEMQCRFADHADKVLIYTCFVLRFIVLANELRRQLPVLDREVLIEVESIIRLQFKLSKLIETESGFVNIEVIKFYDCHRIVCSLPPVESTKDEHSRLVTLI